jgi:hypothetical protein
MRQTDINTDLNSYLHERKNKPFWQKFKPKIKPRKDIDVDAELRKDIEKIATSENITPEDKHELESMEQKIDEVNKVEIQVEHDIEEEHESLLRKFFKKLNFSRKNSPSKDEDVDLEDITPVKNIDIISEEHDEVVMSDAELREMLHGLHDWIAQLPPDKLEEFKQSKDFELYTKYLRKHNLIR